MQQGPNLLSLIVSILTSLSLLVGLALFAGRLFSKIDRLLSLPSTVKKIQRDLHNNTLATQQVKQESQEWRKESSNWHKDHIRREHGDE